MKKTSQTSASSAEDSPLVEVMDRNNRALAAMPAAEVRRQQLCHRSVVILLFDEAGRLFLRKRPRLRGQGPERWDLPVRSPAFSGESMQDAATRALEEVLGIHAERMRLVQVIPPSLENGNEHQHVFSLVRPEGSAQHDPQSESEGYYFGAEEMECLLRDFRELVAARFLLLAQALQLMSRRRRPL